ncbi:MAG: hypothetical protein WED11_13025 [Natronospirillum sp.]
MSVTDVDYAILLSKGCDEARPDSLRLYERPAALLNTDAGSLQGFVQDYIEQLPVALRTAQTSARQLRLSELIFPVTNAAESFFTRECRLSQEGGMLALLDRAYLGHRMLEELNDHLHVRLGNYILHVDMTEANSLVHTLLGDPYASEIETIVNQTMGLLLASLDEAPPNKQSPWYTQVEHYPHNKPQSMESFVERSSMRRQLPG